MVGGAPMLLASKNIIENAVKKTPKIIRRSWAGGVKASGFG